MKKTDKSDTPLTDKELAKTGEEFIRFFLPDFTRKLERKLHKAQKEAKEWKKLLGIMIQEDEDNFNNLERICLRHGATEADIGAGYGYGALGVIGLSDWLDTKLKQLLWNEC
jgi:hypothetical protein